nr:SCP2 sterol-binding domain-containing protein [Deltaproteobacteria bacterium]
LKNGAGSVKQGEGAADCTLELTEADLLALTQGKADAMKLFTTGKLKISGNVMASQKLQFLSKLDPTKAVEVIAKRRAAGGTAAAPAAAAPAAATAANAPAFFAALTKRVAENAQLTQEVRATVKFAVTGPDATQTFALGGKEPNTVDATITIADADLAELSAGKVRELYQRGKLRIDGDVSVAHRLGVLKSLI